MKKMHEYELVRRMYYIEGLSRREISRRTGYHRETIEKMLSNAVPKEYRLREPRKSKLDPFKAVIDEMLEADKQAPRKQRHTSWRILQRIKEEHGYEGGYTIVKDYLQIKRATGKEVYFPLEQRPGTAQNDFGHAKVIIAGKPEEASIYHKVLIYSDAQYFRAYPTEAIEAVQDAHVRAYEFFKGVPETEIYDNMSTVVKRVLKGKDRECTEGFLALKSHYLFESRFCNIKKGNEKGVVEGGVKYVRRNYLTPVPEFADWEGLNRHLEECCRKRLGMKAKGKDKTIRELLEEERPNLREQPSARFEACRTEDRKATSQSLVTYRGSYYSVPVEYAYREVTLKAYVDKVRISHKDKIIAEHKRTYEKNEYKMEPLHYIKLLERKPGGLEGAKPFSKWELPECFDELQKDLEAKNRKREYIQVLQLLNEHSITELGEAIREAFRYRAISYESVKMLVTSRKEPEMTAETLSAEKLITLPRININRQDTAKYAKLLTGERQ